MRRPAGERQLLNVISNSKNNFAGHILRGDEIVKEVIEGRMEGKRGRGRPITGMLDELIVASYGYTNRRTEDREGWRSKVLWTSVRQDTDEGYNRHSNTILNALRNSSCQMSPSLPLTTGHGMSALHVRQAVWIRGDQLPGNLVLEDAKHFTLFFITLSNLFTNYISCYLMLLFIL